MSDSPEFIQTLRLSAEPSQPRHHLTDLTLARLQMIADEFGLGRIVRMDQPLTTQCNVTDPFRTGQGTFLLRVRHGEEYGERVEFLHTIMDHLRSDGLPVPEVMRTDGGRSWTLWGERIVEVHRYVSHEEGVHRDWRRMYSAASRLADLHNSLVGFQPTTPPVPPEMRNDLAPAECWNMIAQVEHNLIGGTGELVERTRAIEVLDRLKNLLTPLMDDYQRILGNLPWTFVHGDYHFWNLLYRGDEVVGIVDFDFLQERERLFDLSYGMQSLLSYFNYVEGEPSEGFERMAWDNVRIWVDHYDSASTRPLTAVERARLPMDLVRIFLVNVVVGAAQENPLEVLGNAERNLPLYEWISMQPGLFKT